VQLYEKVVQLSFHSAKESVQGKPKWQLWAEKVTFQLKRHLLRVYNISQNSDPGKPHHLFIGTSSLGQLPYYSLEHLLLDSSLLIH
jgi:hypothetical protein